MGKNLKGKELGAGLYQRKDGKYCGRFYDRFGIRRYVYGKTISETKEKLNTAIYEDKMEMNVADKTVTLNEWYQKWLEIYKYKVIAPSTRVQYESIYKKHIQADFGHMKLKDIQPLQIRGKLVNLDKEGFGYETQNKVRILLLDMFNKAVADNVAMKNPVRNIKVVRDEKKEPRVLSIEEQSAFFDTCKGTFYDNLFNVAISTGLRPGELYALEAEDLDFEKKVVSGKNSAKALKGFENLIFTTKYDTPLNAQIYADAIKIIVEQINLMREELEQFETFSGHCFRHTFATRCFEAGIQPKTVQKYLGHATLQMTMDLYTHVLENHLSDEMDKLDSRLEMIELSSDDLAEQRFEREYRKQNEVLSYDKLIRIGEMGV